IIGIGKTIYKPTKLSRSEEIIGYTTVFKSDGDYRLNSCTPPSDFLSYEKNLETLIIESVNEVAKLEGIGEGETIRIIFHVFKKTGRREVNAVNNAVGKLGMYSIEWAL